MIDAAGAVGAVAAAAATLLANKDPKVAVGVGVAAVVAACAAPKMPLPGAAGVAVRSAAAAGGFPNKLVVVVAVGRANEPSEPLEAELTGFASLLKNKPPAVEAPVAAAAAELFNPPKSELG